MDCPTQTPGKETHAGDGITLITRAWEMGESCFDTTRLLYGGGSR